MTQPAPMSGYGILDEDGFWMGDENGPKVLENEILARLALEVLREQFPHKHFVVEPFTSASRIHDEITSDITTGEAIRLVEGRTSPRRRSLPTPGAPQE